MTEIKLEVYVCSHCSGPVKPDAERCEYCGFWFKMPEKLPTLEESDVYMAFVEKEILAVRFSDGDGDLLVPVTEIDVSMSGGNTRMDVPSGASYNLRLQPEVIQGSVSMVVEGPMRNCFVNRRDKEFDVLYVGDGKVNPVLRGCRSTTVFYEYQDHRLFARMNFKAMEMVEVMV